MSVDHGMNVAEVEQFGKRLQTHFAARIGEIANEIESVVGATSSSWVGPDAERFRSWWPAKRSFMQRTAEDINGFGQAALNNASQQRDASDDLNFAVRPFHPGRPPSIDHPEDATPPPESGPARRGSEYVPGPQRFSNSHFADLAEKEALTDPSKYRGQTGWNQPGECMVAMKRWLNAAGGSWPGSPSGPLSGYEAAEAADVPVGELSRGDVLQRSVEGSTEWSGVHTMVVLEVDPSNPDLVTVAESNFDSNGSMRVAVHDLSKPHSSGATWRGFRLGSEP